jgi:hypothetical protein
VTGVRSTVTVAAVVAGLLLTAVPASATSRVITDTCPKGAVLGFGDVSARSVHAPAIACVRHHGITLGTTSTTYAPASKLRRDQLASFLVRTLEAGGVRLPTATRDHFTDDGQTVHEPAIDTLAEARIVPTSSSRFEPSRYASRGEMAELTAAALRYAGVLSPTSFDLFTDDAGRSSERAANELAVAGVVEGRVPGLFAPGSALRRDQMASFLARSLDLILDGGSAPEAPPPVRAPEGWLVAGGTGRLVGTGGATTRYTVEIADGLHTRQQLTAFASFVEATLSQREHGWTARGGHRLQRVDDPAAAKVRVVLGTPATVDRLCGRVGLDTAGVYSCWTGRVAALNSDRWFRGVGHVTDLHLYRTYLVNHEVGHGLGYGHRSCPGRGRLAPVMMQLSKSTYGCVPNGYPFP